MKNINSLMGCVILFSSFLLAACGGGSGGEESDNQTASPSASTAKSGTLIDSAVANIGYRTATQSGVTDAKGGFPYQIGESVVFFIGDLTFPAVKAGVVVTPISIAGADAIADRQASNIARLLQSLDEDADPSNGISIPDGAAAAAAPIDFDVDATRFESNPAVVNLVANSGSSTTTLISAATAEAHVTATLGALSADIPGVWKVVHGKEFSYLVLFDDKTFFYAENDLSAKTPQENGLEAGSYAYDPADGKLTFTLAYDDNAPGEDSGVGDIGTPAVYGAAPSPTDSFTLTRFTASDVTFSGVDFASGASPIVGAWRSTDSTTGEFEYLLLMPDGSFLYAENDPNAQTAAENGLEVGSYSYDAGAGKLTFNIKYDDNAPGDDSGIGDIGTPAMEGVSLSNSNNTLTGEGGEPVFERAF